MPKHVRLKIYAVEVVERAASETDSVTLEFDGELKKKTKDAVTSALAAGGYRFIFKKKVLA